MIFSLNPPNLQTYRTVKFESVKKLKNYDNSLRNMNFNMTKNTHVKPTPPTPTLRPVTKINPKPNPKPNPKLNPKLNPKPNPKLNPKLNPKPNPKLNPKLNPKPNPKLNPKLNPKPKLRRNTNSSKVILFTNARDESNIKEWVAHHLLLGFNHIHIYDHKSKVHLKNQFINFPNVTVDRCELDGPIKNVLINDAVEISKKLNADWMLYLDADEFIVINDSNIDSVQELLSYYDYADSLSCNWLLFGTNYLKETPDGLIIDNYTRSEIWLNDHIKTFIRPSEFTIPNAHRSSIKNSDKAYHFNGTNLNKVTPIFLENKHYINTNKIENEKIFVAHYITQSEETYVKRKVNLKRDDTNSYREPNIILNSHKKIDETHTIHHLFNDVINTTVKDKYSKKIKIFLNKKINDNGLLQEAEPAAQANEVIKKNIIIYPHMDFELVNGGLVVLYKFASVLEEHGNVVRIFQKPTVNPIFSKFYNNDFPIDDSSIVIYCEGTQGNPLNAKYVVRWMLSKLGQNVPFNCALKWDKNELVYYICNEEKIYKNPDKIDNIYKLHHIFYFHPSVVNYNLKERTKTCFSYRKANYIHISCGTDMPKNIHPLNSVELTMNTTLMDCIKIFNQCEYFISYDTITWLSVISALCGCIAIVVNANGVSEKDWLNTQGACISDYFKQTGESELYGIAYGKERIEFAKKTIHLARDQWNRIEKCTQELYIKKFTNDMNNWDCNVNTVKNNFFIPMDNYFPEPVLLEKNKKPKKLFGVYFICCINNYLNIVKEQLKFLDKGLINITTKVIVFITHYDENKCSELDIILNSYNDKFILVKTNENLYEKYAIINYKKYIPEKEEYYLYYFHTKGVSYKNGNEIFDSRRQRLNYYTLEQYNINIELLNFYDAVGCGLHRYPKKHFSGNFWWSKSSYLQTLDFIDENYFSCEMYILSNDNCKYISLDNDTNNLLVGNYNFLDEENIKKNITTKFINNIENENMCQKLFAS
jgi:hypothetical protein